MKKQVLISGIAAMAALTASAQPCSWGLQQITQSPINPFTISFTPQTTGSVPNSVSYAWDFGDGNYGSSVSYSSTVVHPYCNPGNYTVVVWAIDSLNPSCSFSMQTVASITATPFSITSINVDASADPIVHFTANVNNPYGLNLSYTWDFNYPSNSTGSGNPVTHNYNNQGNGTYSVMVNVSANGCSKSGSTQVTINNSCFAFPNISVISNNDPTFTFSVSVNPAPSSNATYQWSFDDGNILNTNTDNTAYTYTSNGSYNVCVFITDPSSACTYSGACVPVTVSNANNGGGNSPLTCSLSINFTPDSANANANVWYYNYSDVSSDPNATVTYWWNFGDGNTSTQASPTHTYSAVGNYSVCLTITYINSTDTCVVSSCGFISNAQFLYKVGTPLGMKDISIANLIVFPNPSQDVLFVTSPVNISGTIQIIDITGREIIHKNVENVTYIEINTSVLNNGTYFLKYKDNSGNDVTKMIIKN